MVSMTFSAIFYFKKYQFVQKYFYVCWLQMKGKQFTEAFTYFKLYFKVLSGILQVLEDLHAIWDWILIEKLHIPHSERNLYSAILVVPETFDNRGTCQNDTSSRLQFFHFIIF